MLSDEALSLIKSVARCGVAFHISDDGSLIISPEALVPSSLREQLFASEQACVETLRTLRQGTARFM